MQTVKNILYFLVYPFYSLIFPGRDVILFKRSQGCWWAKRPSGIWCKVDRPRPNLVSEYLRYFSLKSGDVVFDVGGELGKETKEFSDLVGPEGKVYVFECFPEHITRLKEIAHEKGNIEVVPNACWNVPQKLTLYKGFTPGSNTWKQHPGHRCYWSAKAAFG